METAVTAPPTNQVTVTVNGVERQFPKGKNLLAALLDQDTQVPHYCWHPSLSIAGNCRLCLIEIVGQPRPSIACNMTCTDGLKINTEGAMVEDCRKGMMEFLLVNHPLDCPVCDRGGECQLQRYSMEYGTGHARTVDPRRRFPKPQFDPLIDLERNRCILCTRCVRFMDEVAGHHTLGIFARGNRNYIGTFGNGPVSSVFSGNIIDLCPVGCLTSKPFRFQARVWELQQSGSTCTLCSAGCPTTSWLRDGQLLRTTPPARKYNHDYTIDEDTTQFICNEGRFGNYYVNAPDRIKTPFAQVNSGFTTVSLGVAVQSAHEALAKAAAEGPDKVAILAGARTSNEEGYLLSRLARAVLGTNQIDSRLGFVTPEAARAAGAALAAGDGDLAELEKKSYAATLVINAPLQEAVPVIGLKIKEAARRKQTKLAVLDTRHDGWLSKHAAATCAAAPEKLAGGIEILTASIGAEGLQLPPELNALRGVLTGVETGLIVLGIDTAGGLFTPQILAAVFGLMEKLGPGWKFLPVFTGRNLKGLYSAGAMSDRLPGGAVDADSARNLAAELWGGVKAAAKSCPNAIEILQRAAEGKIKTLLLHRADELVHHALRPLIEKALAATETVIAIDTFPSWITEKATIVLPGAQFFETTGSFASADGTLQSIIRGAQPPGEAQENWRLILALSGGLDGTPRYAEVAQIFAELLSSWKTARFRMEDLKLDDHGAEGPQRPSYMLGKRKRPDFKLTGHRAKFTPKEAAPAPVPEGLRLQWFNAIQGPDHLASRSAEFDALRPRVVIEINPDDAAALGLASGDMAALKGHGRDAACAVSLNASLPRGIVFGGGNALGLSLDAVPAGLPRVELTKVEG